ncbi:MAG: HAD family hydrolase [Bacillota bacterium]|nr:HAD family hydrolase [Bacillota bacterium]
MYKNYIFDLYGTLVDINTNESRRTLWEKLSLFYGYNGAVYSFRELKKAYLDEVNKRLEDNTKTKYPDTKICLVFEKLYKDKGVNVDKDTVLQTMKLFRILSTSYIRLYPGVKELLTELKARGKKVFMLSNGQREFTVPELKYLGIHDYFDGLHSSSDIEICKPDKAFFDHVIETEGLNKDECIFIGNDDICDVGGAKGASIDSLYIHSNLSRKITKVTSNYEIWDKNISKILELTVK